MTAEEVALRRFRAAVEFARFHRKESASAARLGNAVEQYAHWRLSSAARDTASDIANIIRAIRAERENRPRIVDVDVLGIAPKEVYPEPVDRHTSSSWQMYRFRFGDLVEIDLGRGRVIRIHGGPRAGAAEEAAR